MANDIDVFQLLTSYARRNSQSAVPYRDFALAIQRQAKLGDQGDPLYRDLSGNPDVVLVPRLFLLANERKILLETAGNEIQSIVLPSRYVDVFFREYKRMEESPDLPFPSEDSLRLVVPAQWIQEVAMASDLGHLSEKGGDVPLYRIVFHGDARPIVVPAEFVPDKLIEYSVFKIRQYLNRGGNKEYVHNKLIYAFAGREGLLRDMMTALLSKPLDTAAAIKSQSSDSLYSFWAYLSTTIRKDLDKKNEKTAEDKALGQSLLLCEFYVNFFKNKVQKSFDFETTIKAFDAALRRQPYHFSLEEILAFKDSKGAPLLGKVDRSAYENILREKTTKTRDDLLPELLVIGAGGKRRFIAKDRIFLLAVRQIAEARTELRTQVVNQWHDVLEEFRSLPAMNDDEPFRRDLAARLEAFFPVLHCLIREKLLTLVYEELRRLGEAPAEIAQLFRKGELVPLDELLGLSRRPLVVDARMLLPFWYTIPVFSGLVRFFHRRALRKQAVVQERRQQAKRSDVASEARTQPERPDRKVEFATAAAKVAASLLPEGYGLDEYLRVLENRWNTILDPKAKSNLTEDVRSLVRDHLRGVLRSMRGATLTAERVRNLAVNLATSPSLLRISNHQALELYIQLYMTKVLGAERIKS